MVANGHVDSPSRVTDLSMMHVFILRESVEKMRITWLHKVCKETQMLAKSSLK